MLQTHIQIKIAHGLGPAALTRGFLLVRKET